MRSDRVLAVVLPGQEVEIVRALPALIAVARAEHASVRLACFQPLPSSPVDHGMGGTFLSDGHMARVSGAILRSLRDAVRRFHDVSPEVVVRFGSLPGEVVSELEAYEPALVALLAPRATSVLTRLRGWLVRRQIARTSPARMLVVETPHGPGAWRRRVQDAAAG